MFFIFVLDDFFISFASFLFSIAISVWRSGPVFCPKNGQLATATGFWLSKDQTELNKPVKTGFFQFWSQQVKSIKTDILIVFCI